MEERTTDIFLQLSAYSRSFGIDKSQAFTAPKAKNGSQSAGASLIRILNSHIMLKCRPIGKAVF
ncbi:hypothetical protein QUF80_14625 [Desulfococcaceae bacterium HSG8]|nr:hypothetical protein [Desulfococcaceae bacterium HSG8]